MQHFELARRYARALLDAAPSAEAATTALADVRFAHDVLLRLPEWRALLSDPIRPASERTAHLRAALEPHIGRLALAFLGEVARKRRLTFLGEILRTAEAMHDKRCGILRVRMTSARPMTESRRLQLEQRLAERAGVDVLKLDVEVDPTLIGGCVLHVDGRRIDGSCRGRLEAIRERINLD